MFLKYYAQFSIAPLPPFGRVQSWEETKTQAFLIVSTHNCIKYFINSIFYSKFLDVHTILQFWKVVKGFSVFPIFDQHKISFPMVYNICTFEKKFLTLPGGWPGPGR